MVKGNCRHRNFLRGTGNLSCRGHFIRKGFFWKICVRKLGDEGERRTGQSFMRRVSQIREMRSWVAFGRGPLDSGPFLRARPGSGSRRPTRLLVKHTRLTELPTPTKPISHNTKSLKEIKKTEIIASNMFFDESGYQAPEAGIIEAESSL